MNVIFKTEGSEYIAYETTSKSIIFGDEDLSINLKNRQKDEETIIDICSDKNGDLVIGAATGHRYVAQVTIPGTEYEETETGETDEDGNAVAEMTAKDFDIDNCTLYLYALEV